MSYEGNRRYRDAQGALSKLYGDTTLSLEQAVEAFSDLREVCDQNVQVLEEDIKNRDGE